MSIEIRRKGQVDALLAAANSIGQSQQKIIDELRTELRETKALLDLYRNNTVAYECTCGQCQKTFIGEKEQHICFGCLKSSVDSAISQHSQLHLKGGDAT